MKNVFILFGFTVLSFGALSGRASVQDTTAYWHFSYNDQPTLELGSEGYVFEISTDTIYGFDILTMRYWPGCLVCEDCPVNLVVMNEQNTLIDHGKGKGDWLPIYIKLWPVIVDHELSGSQYFKVYYFYGDYKANTKPLHVLTLKIVG